jgi:predicted membrane-bound spermidine synthase
VPRAVLPLASFVFFLSGVSALIFETLWFRQAGLAFGNSLWASALVLSSFMAGLALGNGLAARHGERLRDPIRFYAVLEVAIAAAGVQLVWFLPRFTPFLAFALRPLLDAPWLLQPARFAAAFVLLLVPAVAMGATLPTFVKAVSGGERDFGRLLGRLYGWNTLGAVAGALSGELFWIPRVGVLLSAGVAAGGNLLAAALALGLARQLGRAQRVGEPAVPRRPFTRAALRLLLASFGSGGILLALEVVWFRMLALFSPNTSGAFALMLAVVLAGIGLGGLLAALWLRARPRAHGGVAALALLSGAVSVVGYRLLPLARARWSDAELFGPLATLTLSLALMFATSLLSGVLFVFLGKRLNEELGSGVRSAGLVTLANTLGAMLGPLVASFVLLPGIGMERSLFLLALAYGGVALCAPGLGSGASPRGLAPSAAALGLFVLALIRFPSGLIEGMHRAFLATFADETVIALREGVSGTLAYLRSDWLDAPYSYRLVTDNYPMAGNELIGKRYMELFAYLPLAFHAQPKQALLISYGLGSTAKALVDEDRLEHIDVVDISREILEMGELVFPPGEDPLGDPRVEIHVEDGRYFLHTTQRRYDLITGEPPPPALAGVVNLYTREYFELLRSRLAEGGLVSYWLPVMQMLPDEAKAITGAFCAAFPDCSLWEGTPRDWIMLGSRDARGPIPEEVIRLPWTQPRRLARLRIIGIERAEQLAALFLADAATLAPWIGDVPPLVDDRPHRAPRLHVWRRPPREFAELTDTSAARRRFAESAFVARLWPEPLRRSSLVYFDYEQIARESLLSGTLPRPIGSLHRVLESTSLETLPLWLVGSDADRQAILDGLAPGAPLVLDAEWHLAMRALAGRDYALAAERLSRLPRGTPPLRDYYWLYALCMAGRVEEAREEALRLPSPGTAPEFYWPFMRATFGVSPEP